MLVTARAEYACLAMLELAALYGGDPKPARLADVADRHDIPQRFLVQILLQLKGGGLVASTRGAAGGYHLARPPEEISLADILGVIERTGPNPVGRKVEPTPLAAVLHGVWDKVLAARLRVLSETTLAQLLAAGHGLQYVI